MRKHLKEALEVFKCDRYEGIAESTAKKPYFVWNDVGDSVTFYAEGKPIESVEYIQIHYFEKSGVNVTSRIKEIKESLFNNGFTYPEIGYNKIEESNGEKIRHIVFECGYNM